jgi:hypothetical protein
MTSGDVKPLTRPLDNGRQEQFCLAYASHGNGTRAAQEAGYSPSGNVNGAATRAVALLKRADIQARIAHLRAVVQRQVAKTVAVDRGWVLKMLIENAESAIEAKDRTSANRALELVGKELGMFIDRKMEVRSPLDALTAQELTALVDLIDRGGLRDVTPMRHGRNDADVIDIAAQSGLNSGVHAGNVPIEEGEAAAGKG